MTSLYCSFFSGGESEIRTRDTGEGIPPFQGGALGHYATSPRQRECSAQAHFIQATLTNRSTCVKKEHLLQGVRLS